MKKIFFWVAALSLLISACGTTKSPSVPAEAAANNPSPMPKVNLEATAAVMMQQTLQAMPSATLPPSATPIVITETPTVTVTPTSNATATETQNPVLLTLTATLGTGTPDTMGTFIPTDASGIQPTLDLSTQTGTAQPLTYGTMPPNLPSGKVYLINKANADVYISLHCTTKSGYKTYIEYPVEGKIQVIVPAGNYYFVAWVGGKKFTGNFHLSVDGAAVVTMFIDRVEAK